MRLHISLGCIPTKLAKDGKAPLCKVKLNIDAAIIADAYIRFADYCVIVEFGSKTVELCAADFPQPGRVNKIDRFLSHHIGGNP